MEHNTIYQDNRSTMILETNIRVSNGKRTKYTKTRYYLVKNTVDMGDLKIEWYLTEEMWADLIIPII